MRLRGLGAGGATLLQLAATFALVAVLVLLAIPAYKEYRLRAYLSEARQAASAWKTQATAWYSVRGTWQGASDQAIGWTNPPSRFWIYGPHRYGPQGWPGESWFVATLRPGLRALGAAMAQNQNDPDYALILSTTSAPLECGLLVHRSCGNRTGINPNVLPPDGPVLNPLARTTTTITVGWAPAARAEGYRIQHRRQGEQAWQDSSPDLPDSANSWTITGLQEETQYEIRGIAFNQHGSTAGPILAWQTTGTPPDCEPLIVMDTTTTSISVSWTPDQRTTSRTLRWRKYQDQNWEGQVTLPANSTSHTLWNLQQATHYVLELIPQGTWGSPPNGCPGVTASTRQDPEAYGVKFVYGWFYWPSNMSLASFASANPKPRVNAPRDMVFNYAGYWYSFLQAGGQSGPLRLYKAPVLGNSNAWTQAFPDFYLPQGEWLYSYSVAEQPYIDPQGRLWFLTSRGGSEKYLWGYSLVTGAVQRILSFPVCDFVRPTGRGRLAVVGAYIAGEGCNNRRILYTTDGGNTWGSHYAWPGYVFDYPVSLNANLIGLTMRSFYCCMYQYYYILAILRPDGQLVANAGSPFYNWPGWIDQFAHGLLSDGRMWATFHTANNDGNYPAHAHTTSPESNSGWQHFVKPQYGMWDRPVRIFRSGGADFAIGPYGGYCGHDGMYTRLNSSWFDTYVTTCIWPLRPFWTTEDFR
jgi:hypothetical protein